MKVLALTRYGQQGASSRMRSFQFFPAMQGNGWELTIAPLFDDARLSTRYREGSYRLSAVISSYIERLRFLLRRAEFDFLWIEKEALPWLPAGFESWMLKDVPYVLDFDDAIFHKYDLHRMSWVRRTYGNRIDHLMARARLVVAGNRYLAERAEKAGARRVEVFPTVVDLERYRGKERSEAVQEWNRSDAESIPRVVWIGSPSTVRYLTGIGPSLAILAGKRRFVLRVIGGGEVVIPGVQVENVNWSAETEAKAIRDCDIGIMPLLDSPWERGKCAYKLIQYMASGLPTVSSPVGANVDVVVADETGFFASSSEEWVESLDRLLSDDVMRALLGENGRRRVEKYYSLQSAAPRLIKSLVSAVSYH